MANSVDPDQLASSELIWIYTVCKGRAYSGSAGLGWSIQISYLPKIRTCPWEANSWDPDQMLHSAMSDLGLCCLLMSSVQILGVNKVFLVLKLTDGAAFLVNAHNTFLWNKYKQKKKMPKHILHKKKKKKNIFWKCLYLGLQFPVRVMS